MRLKEITYQLGQKKPDVTFCYIDVGLIDNKSHKISNNQNIIEPDSAPSRARKIVRKGTILYSTVRPYLQNICILEDDFPHPPIASTAFAAMETFKGIHQKFLLYYLLSPVFTDFVSKSMVGVAYPAINDENLYNIIVPLPPISEQKRIVAKIEELLPFIEQYAKKEQELTALHQAFPEQMKKSILQAAIQGKLTEQNPNDESAVELIKRIQEEKERLILEKKIKKPKQRSEIIVRDNSHYEIVDGVERCIDDEIPFEIPENWCWVRLKDITYQLGQEIPKSTFCYIDVGLVDNKLHRISNNQNIIEPNDAPSRARKIVQKGTILYSTVRPYLKNICILEEDFPYTPIASTAFATMETFQDIDRKFLFYYLLSPTFTDFVNQAMVGVAYPAINDENLYKIVVPIPPLEEQQRIVSKIEELFSYLENLTK